jgi:hypothetical protein
MNIRFTLVAEGSTDKALVPILRWAVRCDPRIREITPQFAEPGNLSPPRGELAKRIGKALDLYPADLLFVHRDSDGLPPETRRDEIRRAVESSVRTQTTVPVVPVRMTEAWLLIDEAAIRSAAGNPRGTTILDLPRLRAIEDKADPKNVLYTALRQACELKGRRLARFSPQDAAGFVAERISDFRPLQCLSAFREFQAELKQALDLLIRTIGT